MRPKLKSDTFFIPIDEGVYVRNNEKSFTIKGKTLAAWLERLAPLLDGQHDLQDLCEALPAEKRQVIKHLILKLADQGCVKDTSHELPHTLSPAIMETYGPAITFIDYHTDSGAARFQRFLETPVLAIGSGEHLLALAHTLLETGNRAISLLDTGEAATNYGRMQEILDVLRAERDDALRLHRLNTRLWHDEEQLQRLCASVDMVLYFGSGDRLASVDRLNTLCRQAHVPFLPAVVWNDTLHIGPLCRPDHPACWQCLWRRRQATRGLPPYSPDDRRVLYEAEQEIRYPGKPAIGITANILAEAFFTHCTQIDWNTLQEAFLLLDLQHLQNVRHTLFPHPLCTACGEQKSCADQGQAVLEEADRLIKQAPPSEKDQRERLEAWADEEGGIFSLMDYAKYYQLPLTRCQINVPLASDIPYTLPQVQAAELDYPEVYTSAARQAVAVYAESLADARRVCWGTYEQHQEYAVSPERLFGWGDRSSASSLSLAWAWGVQITPDNRAKPVLVPGAAVAPRSSWNQHEGEPLFRLEAPATAIGANWDEALANTLHRINSAISSENEPALTGDGPLFAIDEARYQQDGVCAAYQKILNILRARVCLIDCTGAFGVPRVGAYLDGKWLGISSHWNALCAIRVALKQAVFSEQVRRTPGPNDPRIVKEDLATTQKQAASLARISPQTTPLPSLADETDYAAATTALLASFEQHRWDILVIPLPTDLTVSRIWPCTLRVLALCKESKGRL